MSHEPRSGPVLREMRRQPVVDPVLRNLNGFSIDGAWYITYLMTHIAGRTRLANPTTEERFASAPLTVHRLADLYRQWSSLRRSNIGPACWNH